MGGAGSSSSKETRNGSACALTKTGFLAARKGIVERAQKLIKRTEAVVKKWKAMSRQERDPSISKSDECGLVLEEFLAMEKAVLPELQSMVKKANAISTGMDAGDHRRPYTPMRN